MFLSNVSSIISVALWARLFDLVDLIIFEQLAYSRYVIVRRTRDLSFASPRPLPTHHR